MGLNLIYHKNKIISPTASSTYHIIKVSHSPTIHFFKNKITINKSTLSLLK